MRNIIANIKTRINFLNSIIKMFTLDYNVNDLATTSMLFSTLSNAENCVADLRKATAIKISNILLQSVPIRNLLSLSKFERLKFILGISKLYKLECTENRGKQYKIHLIANNKESATKLWKQENPQDNVVDVQEIKVCETNLLSLNYVLKKIGK